MFARKPIGQNSYFNEVCGHTMWFFSPEAGDAAGKCGEAAQAGFQVGKGGLDEIGVLVGKPADAAQEFATGAVGGGMDLPGTGFVSLIRSGGVGSKLGRRIDPAQNDIDVFVVMFASARHPRHLLTFPV